LEYDHVKLSFDDDALTAIAEKAAERAIGARGLRAIMEKTMTEIMYEIPSDPTIQSVRITKECVTEGAQPVVIRDEANPRLPLTNPGA
jgi:ATP-dependent Clp protease ATP-binding subunit ClpX